MPYKKHQLYLNDYQVLKGGVVELPDNCKWIVMKYLGNKGHRGQFTNIPEEKGGICLILDETRSEKGGFWPVMSFLTDDEARELANELLDLAREKKDEQG